MQNQFAVYLAVMFGFTSCTETETDESTDGLNDTALVGTWVEVRTTYAVVEESSEPEWSSTHRKTIIVEREGDTLHFRNCLDGTSVTATLENAEVTLEGDDYPVLRLSGEDMLIADEDVGDTEVTLTRFSASTNAVMASLNLTQPGNLSIWTQLCLETVVSDSDGYRMAFKATNSLLGVMVGMDFESPTQFDVAQTIPYGGEGEADTVTGEYAVPDLGTGTLANPVGSLVASESTTWDFLADLTMVSTGDDDSSGAVQITGTLNVDPEWFNAE